MNIIGLAGHAGAGKDHTYEYLRDLLSPLYVERIAFADGLKFDIESALGVLPFDIPAIRSKPYSDEIRMLLQWWGTELRREHHGDDYWVLKGMEMAEEASAYAHLVVVTDVRFENEAAVIRDRGGIVVEVYAQRATRLRRLGSLPPAHASEEIDFYIDAMIDSDTDGDSIVPAVVLDWLGALT
jgi:hypothetical protein